MSDDSGCSSRAASASPAPASPHSAVLHIGDIPIARPPAAADATTSTSDAEAAQSQQQQQQQTPATAAAHVVAAAAVAAAAHGQASSATGPSGAPTDPTGTMYMAGVAAGVAAMVAQQQAVRAQQGAYFAPAAPQQQYWDPAHQQHLQYYPQAGPQQQQYYGQMPPPAHYYAQMPAPGYGYPVPSPAGMVPPQHSPYAAYPQHQQQFYDPHQQQHYYAQQQWGVEEPCPNSSMSEASYAHTYPPTPVPSTPTGAASSVFSARTGAMRSRGDTVTVSAASSVKDAAGAVAKVLERQGSCLLVALKRVGEQGCGATHVAAKTLAVSRFYVNARMGAGGAAGGAAARALVAAAEGRAGDGGDAAAAADAAAAVVAAAAAGGSKEEVTFVPFQRSANPQDADSLGFVVFKVRADDLPMALPPPVGQPSALAAAAHPAAAGRPPAAGEQPPPQQQEPPLLKAGAGTDVNKLSNAVIRNVLEWGRVSLQLAGPAACHVAMQALAKARARLAKKFEVSIAVASAFSTEDTSGSLGRATVFYRLDVLRVTGAAAEAAAAGWSAAGLLAAWDDGADGASSVGGW